MFRILGESFNHLRNVVFLDLRLLNVDEYLDRGASRCRGTLCLLVRLFIRVGTLFSFSLPAGVLDSAIDNLLNRDHV